MPLLRCKYTEKSRIHHQLSTAEVTSWNVIAAMVIDSSFSPIS
jgi:hypothetical protein